MIKMALFAACLLLAACEGSKQECPSGETYLQPMLVGKVTILMPLCKH